MNIEQILKRFNKAKSKKHRFLDMYKDVVKYTMPDRYSEVYDEEKSKTRQHLFTSVPEQAAEVFVQRIQSLLTPINETWVGFEAGYGYKTGEEDPKEINAELDKIANMCNVFKDVSNFDSEIPSFYYDLVPGTAFLSLFEGTADNPFNFKVVPFKDITIEEGVDGLPSYYYREMTMRKENVKEQWKDAKFQYHGDKAQEEINLLECTYKDGKSWEYIVINTENKKIIVEKSFKTCPFIALRWTKSSGEIYGRGVGLKALNDIMTLNKIKEYGLRALAFAIPLFTASEDGGYDPDTFVFEPGAVNPVASNATNNPSVQQLGVSQQVDLMQFNEQELKMDIKRAMFDTTIPNDPNQMTATEINRRSAELAQQLNTSFGRLMNEFLYPLIKRMVDVLQSFGYLDDTLDVHKFNGFGYKIKINSSLSNMQKAGRFNDMVQTIGTFAAFDPTLQFVGKAVDLTGLTVEMLKMTEIPARLIRSEDEIKQLAEQEAQAMEAQRQQMMSDDVAMSNAKEEGKNAAIERHKSNVS